MRRFLCLCGAGLLAVVLTAGFGCANSAASVRAADPAKVFFAPTQFVSRVVSRRHYGRRGRAFYLPRTVPAYRGRVVRSGPIVYGGGPAVYWYEPPIVVRPIVVQEVFQPASGFTLVAPPSFGEAVTINGIRYVPAPSIVVPAER